MDLREKQTAPDGAEPAGAPAPSPQDPRAAEKAQAVVVDFLNDPVSHEGAPVSRITTHLSHLFLAGDTVHKLKRAVRLDFVDFSGLAARRSACEAELVHNADAGSLYRQVLAVVRGPGGQLRLAAPGTEGPEDVVLDYVVEMARFDEINRFDHMLSDGRLDICHLRSLAEKVASRHQRSPAEPAFGGAVQVRRLISDVSDTLSHALRDTRFGPDVTAWRAQALAEVDIHAARLDARRRHGRVKRCHGDLHLANVCLYEGEPLPFDAIEFSRPIATIDVLYDIAFTVMDLLRFGRRDLANLFLDRYLEMTDDYRGLALMPLFVSLRAGIRAMTSALEDQHTDWEGPIETYLSLARQTLNPAPGPRLITVSGYSGSGKSTLASALAPALPGLVGAVNLRTDCTRKRLAGVAPETPAPREAYCKEMTDATYRRLLRDARQALAVGVTVILDGAFLLASERREAEALAKRAGVPFTGLWLELPEETLCDRVRTRKGDASDATEDVVHKQWSCAEPAREWLKVDTSRPAVETAAELAKRLAE